MIIRDLYPPFSNLINGTLVINSMDQFVLDFPGKNILKFCAINLGIEKELFNEVCKDISSYYNQLENKISNPSPSAKIVESNFALNYFGFKYTPVSRNTTHGRTITMMRDLRLSAKNKLRDHYRNLFQSKFN